MRAGFIGLVFTRARDRQLDQHGGNGREDDHEQRRQSATVTIIVTTAESAKQSGPITHTGHESNRAREGSSNRTDEDVTIAYVPEFVGQHALQFLIIQQIENALRHGY